MAAPPLHVPAHAPPLPYTGVVFRAIRQARGLSLETVAAALGCDMTALARVKIGSRPLSPEWEVRLVGYYLPARFNRHRSTPASPATREERPKAVVAPRGHAFSASLARVYLVLQAYARLRSKAVGPWRLRQSSPALPVSEAGGAPPHPGPPITRL